MLSGVERSRTEIGRLRVRWPDAAPRDGPRRLHSLVERAELRPPGLSPSAILCVRNLCERVPADGGDSGEWERGLVTRLDVLCRRAARPSRAPPGADVEAVLFADMAELLACLAADWQAGVLRSRWWWAGLLRRCGPGSPVAREWARSSEYVPAAMAILATMGRLIQVTSAFQVVEAETVVRALVARYGLHASLTSLAAPQAGRARPLASIAQEPSPAKAHPIAPWSSVAPEASATGLAHEHRMLIGLGLALHRTPHLAGEARFGEAVRRWNEAARQVVRAHGMKPLDITRTPTLERPLSRRRRSRPRAPRTGSTGKPVTAGPLPSALARKEAHRADAAWHETADSRGAHEYHTEDPLGPRRPVVTEHGGAFYLLNLALALELYGDFTSPGRPGIALPVWDFVHIVARELVGRTFDEDPLPRLLAALAGRPQQDPPGADFRPDGDWRVPSSWCVPFPERAGWTWSATLRRLAIHHPAGFLVADVATTEAGGVHAALERELARFGWPDAGQRPASVGRVRGSPVRRWTRLLLPYIRARLVRALGVAPERVGALVCAHAARIFVTPSHLDVCFGLASLPIEIRLAGLDRDPGWVPASSRVIAFHFE